MCTNEQWVELYDRIAALAREHRSTLVFVNTRRLVERVALHLGERLGKEAVAAHHGSLSRERRHRAERRLKEGDLKVVVATASLELGIDVGAVELTCLIGSPRSISTGLQRIGRSGHALRATPEGPPVPAHPRPAGRVRGPGAGGPAGGDRRRGAAGRAARRAGASRSWPPPPPRSGTRTRSTRSAGRPGPTPTSPEPISTPSSTCSSEGIATSRGRAGTMLHRDGVNRRLRGPARGAAGGAHLGRRHPGQRQLRRAARARGDADRHHRRGLRHRVDGRRHHAARQQLLAHPARRARARAGRGRRRRATHDPVLARRRTGPHPRAVGRGGGAAPGDRATRDPRGRAAKIAGMPGSLMRGCALRLVPRAGAELLRDYVAAGAAALGRRAHPDLRRSPSGSSTTPAACSWSSTRRSAGGSTGPGAWPCASGSAGPSTSSCRRRPPTTGSCCRSGRSTASRSRRCSPCCAAADVDELLTQAALQAPMFETRWRWNAMRSLALLRSRGGQARPARPAADAGPGSHRGGVPGPDRLPGQPWRRGHRGSRPPAGARDGPRLPDRGDGRGGPARASSTPSRPGSIQTLARERPEPSVLAHEILNANPYAFLDDAPLEERRTRAVSVRRGLPAAVVDRIGGLDAGGGGGGGRRGAARPARCRRAARPAARPRRSARGARSRRAGSATCATRWWRPAARPDSRQRPASCTGWPPSGGRWWRPSGRRRGFSRTSWSRRRDGRRPGPSARARWPRSSAATFPCSARPRRRAIAARLAVSEGDVEAALARLEMDGRRAARPLPPRARTGSGRSTTQWCERRLLARINRRMLDGLRREIEPVTAADFLRFLFGWQDVRPGTQLHGQPGLARVIAQLQGFEAAAGAWEREIFPARLVGYDSAWLDALCLSGGVAWGRLEARPGGRHAAAARRPSPLPGAPICRGCWRRGTAGRRRRALSAPRAGRPRVSGANGRQLPGRAHRRHAPAARRGRGRARRAGLGGAGHGRRVLGIAGAHLRDVGRAAAAGPAGTRAGAAGPAARWARAAGRCWDRAPPYPWPRAGRESAEARLAEETRHEAFARQYIKRYGVVFRDLLARESHAPAWRDLVRIYRRLEMSGELRGGRLVGGFVGEQFAAPEAVEALRATRREEKRGEIVQAVGLRPAEPGRDRHAGTARPGDAGQQRRLPRRRSAAERRNGRARARAGSSDASAVA